MLTVAKMVKERGNMEIKDVENVPVLTQIQQEEQEEQIGAFTTKTVHGSSVCAKAMNRTPFLVQTDILEPWGKFAKNHVDAVNVPLSGRINVMMNCMILGLRFGID